MAVRSGRLNACCHVPGESYGAGVSQHHSGVVRSGEDVRKEADVGCEDGVQSGDTQDSLQDKEDSGRLLFAKKVWSGKRGWMEAIETLDNCELIEYCKSFAYSVGIEVGAQRVAA